MLLRAPAVLTLKETPPGRETNATDPSRNDPINQECSGTIVKQAKRLFSALTLGGEGGGLADRNAQRRLNQDLSNYCIVKTLSVFSEDIWRYRCRNTCCLAPATISAQLSWTTAAVAAGWLGVFARKEGGVGGKEIEAC